MVDPRIYRAFLVLAAFVVIVFAFSLQDQPPPRSTQIAAGQFFDTAGQTMSQLANAHPHRSPGSPGDNALAGDVAAALQRVSGFTVSRDSFSAQTADGERTLTNVVATRPGLLSGQVVVLASRDSSAAPDVAGLSGTAVLLDLGRALGGETLGRTVTLISTSGKVGSAGTSRVASELSGRPVDAVIVLGNLSGATVRQPVVVPWSGSELLAPVALRDTLSHYVRAESGIATAGTGVAGQFARLAFPLTVTESAPFATAGIPAVMLSLSGNRTPAPNLELTTGALTDGASARIAELGTATLETVNALDRGAVIPAPSAYVLISDHVLPLWSIRLLVLALIAPVLACTLDAAARLRRRGHSLLRWVAWVLVGALPFLFGVIGLLVAGRVGLLSATPPGAVGAGGVQITAGDLLVLAVLGVVMVSSLVFLRPLCLRAAGRLSVSRRPPQSPAADAAAVAISTVMSVTTFVIWLLDPFSALLLVPALHLWLWLASPGLRSRRAGLGAVIVLSIVPALAVAAYYAVTLGLSPLGLLWSLALMVAGGAMPPIVALYWSVTLGCLAGVIVIGYRSIGAAGVSVDPAPTVRGPATYAGPGSLGGTESALRR